MNYPNLPKTLLAVSVAAALTGCIGEDTASTSGSTGTQQDTQILMASGDRLVQQSSVQTASVAEECGTRGGQAVQSGFDWNGNKILDADEVDKTVYICNGADGSGGGSSLSLTVLEAGSTQCQAGGILLSDGTNTYPLCNAVDVVTPTSLAQAKDLAAGLGNWVSGIDTWATQAAAGMEAQATELESLMSADQVEVSMMAMMYTLQAAVDWLASNNYADGTINLADLLATEIVADTPATAFWGDLIAANGSITAEDGTLTFTDISITVKMGDESAGLENVKANFRVDPVTVPTSSAATTASNTLALSLSNAVATSGDSSVTVPSGSITLNTTNAFRLVPDDLEAEEKWGDFNVAMALGTDTALITITTPGAADKGNISFSGYLGGKVFMNVWTPAGLTNEEHQLSKIENLLALGDLTYNNQTVKINLGLDAPKIQQIDLSYFDTELADLATGNTLNGFLSFTKEDITNAGVGGYVQTEYSHFNGLEEVYFVAQSVQLYRFNLAGNNRNLAVVAYSNDGGITYGRYRIYDVSIYPDGWIYLYNDYDQTSDTAYLKERLLSRGVTFVYGDPTLYAVGFLGGGAKGNVTIRGNLTSSKSEVLAALDGPSGSFNLVVEELDVVNQQARYGNHSEYTLTGSMELNGLQAADGSALTDVSLGYLAKRSGYSNQAGGRVQLSLKHGDQEFIANYLHPRNMDIFAGNDYYNPNGNELDYELMRGTPTRFSFSDNNGGLLHSQSGDSRMYSNCSQWNSNRPEEMALGCVLGADEFGIYIDGVRHGTIYQNNFGEWIAVFADKSEEVIYSYSH